jgi:hypothetical protein
VFVCVCECVSALCVFVCEYVCLCVCVLCVLIILSCCICSCRLVHIIKFNCCCLKEKYKFFWTIKMFSMFSMLNPLTHIVPIGRRLM